MKKNFEFWFQEFACKDFSLERREKSAKTTSEGNLKSGENNFKFQNNLQT